MPESSLNLHMWKGSRTGCQSQELPLELLYKLEVCLEKKKEKVGSHSSCHLTVEMRVIM